MEAIGLGIDTTFDDTSIAILKGKQTILSNLTLSQYADHAEFGGVVPERASRKHLEVIHLLIDEALNEAQVSPQDLQYIAVSNHPGLMGAILVGLTVAKSLSAALKIPLIGVNHVEAHPYANFLIHGELSFPLIHLVVAGGHTLLLHAKNHFDYEIIGRSVDDAAGECMDKVAKMFGHPIPGGPILDKCALSFEPHPHRFPRPLKNKDHLDFSFSGLKTAMLYFLKDHPEAYEQEGPVLSSFFESISDVLVHKTVKACQKYQVPRITLSGGVAASQKLRHDFQAAAQQHNLQLWFPPPKLATDNAAMIACLGAYQLDAGRVSDLQLDAKSNLGC